MGLSEVPATCIPYEECLIRHVREERAGRELLGAEHLAKQVAIHHHLLTTADEAVVFVGRMGHGWIPGDEFVRHATR